MNVPVPDWAGPLCNLYWQLRNSRISQAKRRYWYRKIAREKKRLLDAGVDGEELRLFCRHLSNPLNRHSARAVLLHGAQMQLPFEMPDEVDAELVA